MHWQCYRVPLSVALSPTARRRWGRVPRTLKLQWRGRLDATHLRNWTAGRVGELTSMSSRQTALPAARCRKPETLVSAALRLLPGSGGGASGSARETLCLTRLGLSCCDFVPLAARSVVSMLGTSGDRPRGDTSSDPDGECCSGASAVCGGDKSSVGTSSEGAVGSGMVCSATTSPHPPLEDSMEQVETSESHATAARGTSAQSRKEARRGGAHAAGVNGSGHSRGQRGSTSGSKRGRETCSSASIAEHFVRLPSHSGSTVILPERAGECPVEDWVCLRCTFAHTTSANRTFLLCEVCGFERS